MPVTDLHESAGCGDLERVRALLDAGAEVDALDPWGNTPLLLACFSEVHHPEVVALLRERGADPHRRNIHWDTPRSAAYERSLLSGFDPLGDLPRPDPPESHAGELTEEELAVTVAAVRAVVEQDRPALEAMNAYRGGGDPYTWTHGYGRWGDVHLVVPPGDARSWTMHVIRGEDDWLAVEVELWTREEGRSDLMLDLELERQAGGALRATFRNLHVP